MDGPIYYGDLDFPSVTPARHRKRPARLVLPAVYDDCDCDNGYPIQLPDPSCKRCGGTGSIRKEEQK